MRYFDWNEEKNQLLKESRNITDHTVIKEGTTTINAITTDISKIRTFWAINCDITISTTSTI